jgi:hypothetical protein
MANNPEILEAMACREGLALAYDVYLRRVKLASDCANVIQSFKAAEMLGPCGQIIKKMKSSSADFELCEFAHEGRRSNVEVHNLARGSVYSNVGRHVWFHDPPDGVPVNFVIE